MKRWLVLCGVVLVLGVAVWRVSRLPLSHAVREPSPHYIRYQAPAFLTFDELTSLLANPHPTGALHAKYEALWTTPIISNEAYDAGSRPHRPNSQPLGEFLRVASWNIEHSLHVDEAIAAFTDAAAYSRLLNGRLAPPDSDRYRAAMNERALLDDVDVVVLQEMDLGVKRSGYRDAARDLAQALRMNYVYVPEYLEIDPVLLGLETIPYAEGPEDTEATAHYAVDPQRYRGLFGCAVLSRYPIVHVEACRLTTQGYDWYAQEKQKTSYVERLRRVGAQAVFRERVHREIKAGGRTYFRVDLEVPDLPERRVSVINTHLEIKCTPRMRARQLREILQHIRDIRHPVILAGDFNSAPQDLSPTSAQRVIWREVTSADFWFSRLLGLLTPNAMALDTSRFLFNVTKNYQNPTALDIPLVAPNPVKSLFRRIEQFRFADGGAFDFRGDAVRSAGKAGPLSNANMHDRWGYATTFRVERTIAHLIGKYRLDWVFVKAYLTYPYDRRGPYRFAPHFGRTLNALNAHLVRRISDHDPNVVDLPFHEPPLGRRHDR